MPSTEEKKKKSITIRNGSVRIKIFTARGGGGNGQYVRYEFRWTDHHGVRHRIKRSLLSEAKEEATRIAADLARGHHHAELSLADLSNFRAATQNLVWCGKKLELVTAEYAACLRRLLDGLEGQETPVPSLDDLASFWLANRNAVPVDVEVSKAVDALLEAKTQQGVSERWHASLSSQLKRFAKAHPCNVASIDATRVRSWAYGLPIGPRARNNHLNAVKLLFNQAELRAHRARQAILDIPEITMAETTKLLWHPNEFRRLLDKAPPHILPVLVLGGFGKMRSAEIMRVETANIRLKEKRVLLRAGQAKTRRWRIIPLPDCAVAWLKVCQLPAGKLWPWKTQKFNADLRELAEACELKWRPNALRKSAVTYDQICNPNVNRVAREAGNSPTVLENEYFSLLGVSKKQAEAWFAIRPEKVAKRKIVRLPAQSP